MPGLGESTATAVSCTADANDTMMPTPGLSAGNCWRYSKVRQLVPSVAVDDARDPACVVGIAGGVVDLDARRRRPALPRPGRAARPGRARPAARAARRCRPRSPARRGRRRTANPPATPTNPSTRSTAIASPANPTSSLRRRSGSGAVWARAPSCQTSPGPDGHAVGLGREQRDAVVLGHDLVEQPVHRRGGVHVPGAADGAERPGDQRVQLDGHAGPLRGRGSARHRRRGRPRRGPRGRRRRPTAASAT